MHRGQSSEPKLFINETSHNVYFATLLSGCIVINYTPIKGE